MSNKGERPNTEDAANIESCSSNSSVEVDDCQTIPPECSNFFIIQNLNGSNIYDKNTQSTIVRLHGFLEQLVWQQSIDWSDRAKLYSLDPQRSHKSTKDFFNFLTQLSQPIYQTFVESYFNLRPQHALIQTEISAQISHFACRLKRKRSDSHLVSCLIGYGSPNTQENENNQTRSENKQKKNIQKDNNSSEPGTSSKYQQNASNPEGNQKESENANYSNTNSQSNPTFSQTCAQEMNDKIEDTLARNYLNPPWKYCICQIRKEGNIVECANKIMCSYGQFFHHRFEDESTPCVDYNNEKNWFCPGCQPKQMTRRMPVHNPEKSLGPKSKSFKNAPESQNNSNKAKYQDPEEIDVSENNSTNEESDQETLSYTPELGFDVKLKSQTSQISSPKNVDETTTDCMHRIFSECAPDDTTWSYSPSEHMGQQCLSPDLFSFENYEDDKLDWSDNFNNTFNDESTYTPEEFCEISGIDQNLLSYKLPEKFTLEADKKTWTNYYDFENKIPVGDYGNFIDQLFEKKGIPCSFNAKGKTYLFGDKYSASFRGRCGSSQNGSQDNSCNVKFSIHVLPFNDEDDTVKMEVETKGEFKLFQRQSTGRQLRGKSRQRLKNELKHETAFKAHIDSFTNVPDIRRLHKNYPTRSQHVERKAKSEGAMEGSSRHLDMVVAIRKVEDGFKADPHFQDQKFPDLNGYVKSNVDSPFPMTLLYSPIQLRYAKNCDIIYFDATGNLVEDAVIDQITNKKRQILLHSAIGINSKVPSARGVPLMECLSAKGNVATISNIWMDFISDVRKMNGINWQPKYIVVDMCLSYLHSTVLSFNRESLENYMNRVFEIMMEGKKNSDERKTIVTVCNNHTLHAFARYLRKRIVDKEVISVAILGFAKLIETTLKTEFERICTAIICLFEDKYLSEHMIAYYKGVITGEKETEISDDEVTNYEMLITYDDETLEQMFRSGDDKLKRDKSKFFVHFRNRRDDISANLRATQPVVGSEEANTSSVNEFFNLSVVKTFERWITYFPMWSKSGFLQSDSIPKITLTTARVEEFFKDQKQSFHQKKTFKADFINQHGEVCRNLCELALKLGSMISTKRKGTFSKTNKKSSKPIKRLTKTRGDTFELASSKWKPKRNTKKRLTYKQQLAGKVNSSKFALANKSTYEIKSKADKNTIESPDEDLLDIEFDQNEHITPTRNSKIYNLRKSDSSHGITIESEEVITVEDEDDEEIEDEFHLRNKFWNIQLEEIQNLYTIGQYGINGAESEFLGLVAGGMAGNGVVDVFSHSLIETFKGSYSEQNSHYLVSSTFFIFRQANKGSPPDVSVNSHLLPSARVFDIEQGHLYLIVFYQLHTFLLHVDMESRVITWYDSMPGLINMNQRIRIISAFRDAISERYDLPPFHFVQGHSQAQILSNDCAIICLENLQALLTGANTNTIDAMDTGYFRGNVTRSLLSTTEIGRKFLARYKTPQAVLEAFQRRQRERLIITKYMGYIT